MSFGIRLRPTEVMLHAASGFNGGQPNRDAVCERGALISGCMHKVATKRKLSVLIIGDGCVSVGRLLKPQEKVHRLSSPLEKINPRMTCIGCIVSLLQDPGNYLRY